MAVYIIIGVILVVVTGFFFAFPSPKKTYKKQPVVRVRTTTARHEQAEPPENRYYDLRRMALKVTPELLGLKNMGRVTHVFGVVIDWKSDNGTVTVAAYQTGDASIYFSAGGGIMGGGVYRKVRNAVFPLVKHAEDYVGKSEKTVTTLLPDRDSVGFYLLTNNGTFYAQEERKHIDYGTSDWCTLFNDANNVLTKLRQEAG